MGLYVEDWEIGKALRTRGRTIGEGDISAFAGLVGDWTPIHVDDAYAQTTLFGKRIAHGTLTQSVAIGLMAQMGVFDGTVIGLLSMTWTFQKPVFIGDTIYAEVTALEKRVSSKPGRGIVKLDVLVVNQATVGVCRGLQEVMIMSRAASAGSPGSE